MIYPVGSNLFLANGLVVVMAYLLYRTRRFMRFGRKRNVKTRSHRKNIGAAERLLSIIQQEEKPPVIYMHVRGTTPYIFEEMVLSAFERNGARALRNKSYSGDGGVDGRVQFMGRTFAIQAKKYKKHINNKDVSDFKSIAQRYDGGFFVHTGKTGEQSWQVKGNVHMISGNQLIQLLKGELNLNRYV